MVLSFSYNIPDINEYFLILFMVICVLSIIPVYLIFTVLREKKILEVFSIFYCLYLYLLNIKLIIIMPIVQKQTYGKNFTKLQFLTFTNQLNI